MIRSKAVFCSLALILGTCAPACAQMPASSVLAATGSARGPRPVTLPIKTKLNAWTVGLAGGLLEGAPIRFATEIASVVDERDALHVLPVVTRGPTQNVEALLYLRGI